MNRPEFYLDRLPNGLRLVTAEMPHLHCAEMMCYVGVGGRHEPPELSGISHFLEHMLFRGTADYPDTRRLEEAFERIGGAVNASTDAETTCYHSRLHPDFLGEGARLFSSMLCRPLLQEIDLERRIILEEALEDLNEKGEDINPDNLTSRLLWPDHPLGSPTIGSRESIERIGEADLRAHLKRFYVPVNTVIAVAGPVRRADVVAALSAEFGAWQGEPAPRPLPFTLPPQTADPSAVWVRDSASQVAIQLAFRLPGRDDPRLVAMRTLRRVLSGGGTARLMLRLREELGLTYSVEANLVLYEDSGCFTVDLSVAPTSLVPAVREVLEIFEVLCREAVGEEELERVVRSFLFDLDFSSDHTDEMAVRFGWGELVGCVRTVEQDRREIAAVTAADLLCAARELFVPGAMKLAVTGPFLARDRKEAEKLLKAYRG